ncbi:MAG: hypothetical protein ACTSVV_15355 [Promethearchaeota archaeon]
MTTTNQELTFSIFEEIEDIINYIHYGMSLPFLPPLEKYIKYDIEFYDSKSLIMKENQEVKGHILLYSDKNDKEKILYFGHFQVANHDEALIELLIDKMMEYARKHQFKIIRGPINPPTIIYGWGFLNSKTPPPQITARLPVNPPIYIKIFLGNGFIPIKQDVYREIPIYDILIDEYDYTDYEYFNPKTKEEFVENYYDLFLNMQLENLPKEVSVTPSAAELFKSHHKFVLEYGNRFMFDLVRYKKKNEIIASGLNVPDPFRRDHIIFYSYSVKKEHRRKGLSILMLKNTLDNLKPLGWNYASGRFNTKVKASWKIASKVKASKNISHLLFEKSLFL